MSDIEFIDGLIVKAPRSNAPEYVKASISIKRAELLAWLQARNDEWVNVDIKESKGGKWYAAVNAWKPEERQQRQERADKRTDKRPQADASAGDPFDDDIPFAPITRRAYW